MSQTVFSDDEEVERTLAGEREAFGRLFDRHAPAVRSIVAAVSGDFTAVEDLTQETFLRAYRQLSTLRNPAGFRGWLQGIARLVAKERRRQRAREQSLVASDCIEVATKSDILDTLEHQENHRDVLSAVASLPESERLAVHAYFFHEQNADEAAHAIGISRSGFYAALNRGLERLRHRLSDKARQTSPREKQP